MRLRTLTIAVALFAVALATMPGGGAATATTRVVKIGVLAPLDAGLVEFGTGIRNSAQLAVDQANKRHAVKGWKIELVPMDDSSDPPTGAAGAARLVADPAVIGVVGTYNSGVAAAALPALSAAHLALVSPGNTLASLTLGNDPANPVRPYDNYFRVVASDAEQAPFLARSVRALGARRVAVVSETKAVSKGLADAFAAAFTKDGGKVTLQQLVPDGATDFTGFLEAARSGKPDMIFFGGEYRVAATLRTQATAAGYSAPLVGGDGVKDPAYIDDAGAAAKSSLASTVGVPAGKLSSAQSFLAAYGKAGFSEPPTDFGPYSYDAANVLISAFARVLEGKHSIPANARVKVVAAVQATRTSGSTGHISFDKFGDTTNRVFTLYRVQSSKGQLDWVPINPSAA